MKNSQVSLWLSVVLVAAVLVACSSAPPRATAPAEATRARTASSAAAALPKAGSGKGGYYKDDGPGDNPPEGLEMTVDPIPVVENLSRGSNRPYVVFGKTYTPLTDPQTPFLQRGIGSWYGKKFHGQKTSSGEPYDMYKITAAHPTLPIPSYARVTNLVNGKQIIVRINDRGPFHSNRIIDLSYTGALKLGLLAKGSSQIEVERLLPSDIDRMAENRKNQAPPALPLLALAPVAPVITPLAAAVPEAPAQPDNLMSFEDLLAADQAKPVEQLAAAVPRVASGAYYLQFGAYAIRANAEAIMAHLKTRAESRLPDFDIIAQGSLYRLVSGPFNSRADAQSALAQAGKLGLTQPLVVQR